MERSDEDKVTRRKYTEISVPGGKKGVETTETCIPVEKKPGRLGKLLGRKTKTELVCPTDGKKYQDAKRRIKGG